MTAEPSTVARRPGRPRDERIEGVVVAATLALVAEAGVGRLTTEAVAARAGVSKATLYRRWPSKQALLREAAAALVTGRDRPPGHRPAGRRRPDARRRRDRPLRDRAPGPHHPGAPAISSQASSTTAS